MPRENSRTRPSRTRSSPVRSSHSMRRFSGIVQAVKPREQRQIFGGRKLVVKRNSVAQHADSAPRRFIADVEPENTSRLPCEGFDKPGDDPQQRGLPRAVAPQQRHGRPGRDVQADVAQRSEIAVVFPDAFDLRVRSRRALSIQQHAAQRENREGQSQHPGKLRINARRALRSAARPSPLSSWLRRSYPAFRSEPVPMIFTSKFARLQIVNVSLGLRLLPQRIEAVAGKRDRRRRHQARRRGRVQILSGEGIAGRQSVADVEARLARLQRVIDFIDRRALWSFAAGR